MSKFNRRLFLKGATCTAAGALATGILPSTARVAFGAQGGKVVVAINPDGGKDALSLYMPAGGSLAGHNAALLANRSASTFDFGNGQAALFGGEISLHQRATFLQSEALAGRLNVIWNVGYDTDRRHSRSHQTARDNMEACTANATQAGMLTTGLVKKWQDAGGLSEAINVIDISGGNTGLTNRGAQVVAARNLSQVSFGGIQASEGNIGVNALFDATLADDSASNATKTAITDAIISAKANVALVQDAAAYRDTIIAGFPNTGLGRQLADIAAAIIILPTCFAIAKFGGHDTHSNQDSDQNGGRFWNLVGQLNDALDAFYQALAAAPGGSRANDVVCVSYSEFGRTYRENGSFGTDHAMGAPMMMMGPAVTGGFFGTVDDPSLAVTRNYQNPTTHIAQVWGDVIRWMGNDADAVLSPATTTSLGLIA